MNTRPKKRGDEDDEEFAQPCAVTFVPHKTGTYFIDVYGAIVSPSQFTDAINILGNVSREDEVVFNLQSGGGSLHVTDALIHAIRKTQGHVHFVASVASSAASLLLLEAHTLELTENFYALLHCGSMGSGGTLNEFKASAEFHSKLFEKVLRKSYEGFLTEKEIDELIAGKDFHIDREDWIRRADIRNAYLTDKYEKAVAEATKPPKRTRKKTPTVAE